jgi:hypothetical protein
VVAALVAKAEGAPPVAAMTATCRRRGDPLLMIEKSGQRVGALNTQFDYELVILSTLDCCSQECRVQ